MNKSVKSEDMFEFNDTFVPDEDTSYEYEDREFVEEYVRSRE